LEGGEAKGGEAVRSLRVRSASEFEIHNALPQPST